MQIAILVVLVLVVLVHVPEVVAFYAEWQEVREVARYPTIKEAMRVACAECGLPVDVAENPYFDLSKTGKLNDVLHHASHHLGVDHPLVTVADVMDLLARQ